jgi:uncharacterized repeat protein (TIGR01451 family)
VAAACTTVPSGLVSWWRAEFTAKDSYSVNHGTLQNGAGFAAGKRGQAFSLNGVDQYVEVSDNPAFTLGSNDFTVDAWVKFNSPPGGTLINWASTFVAQDEGPFNVNKWVFGLGGGLLFFHVNSPTLGPQFLAQTAFTPQVGRWYHLTARRTGTTIEIYVDGVLAGAQTNVTLAIPDVNFPLTIGQAENQGFLDGQIDEVEIFSRALSPAEILALHNAGSAGKCQFDVETEFSVSTNPNGAWSYGLSASRGAAFTLYDTPSPGPLEAWTSGATTHPVVFHNTTLSTINPAGSNPMLPRTVVTHPGPSGANNVIRWTAPAAGTYRISSTWEGRDTVGTSTDIAVLLNNNAATPLFSGTISGFAAQQAFLSHIVLQAGDTIEFTTGDGGNGFFNDSTALEAIITPLAAAPPPVLLSVTPNIGPPAGGTPVTLSGQDFQFGATVTFGGAPATSVVVVSPTQITAVTPAGLGLVNVVVTNPDGQFSTLVGGFNFQGQADLDPEIVDLVDPVLVGNNITYSLSVINNGPDDATNVVIQQTLDPTTTFVSAAAGCSHSAGLVTCNVGTVPANTTSAAFQVVVLTTPASAPGVNSTVTASSTELDPNSSNDMGGEATAVNPVADLALVKTDAPDPVVVGSNLT